jgi:ADYC domain
MTNAVVLVGVVGSALVACIPEPDGAVGGQDGDATSEVATPITATGSRCPSWGCDTNAATIGDGILFDEMDLSGAYNAGGVRIDSATLQDTTPVALGVEGDRLVAIDLADSSRVYRGAELTRMIVKLYYAPSPGDLNIPEERIELRINAVITTQASDALTFWEGADDKVETYDIAARRESRPPPKPGDFDIRICKGDLLESVGWPDITSHGALVYAGDHLDAWSRTVEAPVSPTLFNLACAGTAMAKLHLLRHTEASNYNGLYPTAIPDRTAMLKMINADYCGDGRSFTIDGQPLRWQDNTGFAQRPLSLDTTAGGDIWSIEAIWGPSGAICLDIPRRFKPAHILANCEIPKCGFWDILGWASLGHIISGNPP